MRVVHRLAVVVTLATSLLATDVRITEKSGKVRVAKDVGMNPPGLEWSDGDTTGVVNLEDVERFEMKGRVSVPGQADSGIYHAQITLKGGQTITKEIKNFVLSWSDNGVHYQIPGDKISSVSVLKP